MKINEDFEERAAIIEHDGQENPHNALLDLKSGTVLFAGGEEHLDYAKEYIKQNGFTQEQVALVRRNEKILVIIR